MKKIFLVLSLCLGVVFCSNAQISTSTLKNVASKATTAASAAGFDVKSLSSGIMSKLTTKLKLTDTQQTKILGYVTTFLQDKSGILSLAKSNNNKYVAKLATMTESLLSKAKTILTAAQYAKLLGLKPTTNDATNVLSQLFY